MLLPTPRSIYWSPHLWGWWSWRWLGFEWDMRSYRKRQENFVLFCLHHVRTQQEDDHLKARERPPRSQTGWHLDLASPASRTLRNKHLWFQPPSFWYSVTSILGWLRWQVSAGAQCGLCLGPISKQVPAPRCDTLVSALHSVSAMRQAPSMSGFP